jgi:shikimate dehydrogenase
MITGRTTVIAQLGFPTAGFKVPMTDWLRAARAKRCTVPVGTDMLFEMIPAYLDFFGFGPATPEQLRQVARLHY